MTRLKEKILSEIRAEGAIGVGRYMQLALADSEYGYYRTRDPLGRDFITAPEVSQMFGELIGLFFVQAWEDRGRPERFHLLELGPGRGTLMADMLRAARLRPAFALAAEIALIETSPVLREAQARSLEGHRVRWLDDLGALADGAPVFAVANEFLDALPVMQLVKDGPRWRERVVAEADGGLAFALGDDIEAGIVPLNLRDAPDGAVFEWGAEAQAAVRSLAGLVAGSNGVALLIDYGHGWSALGDSLQAMAAHRFVDPLAAPGEADLTAHVDFGAMAEAAREAGARVSGPVTQKAFLEALGIELRAEQLKRSAPDTAKEIDLACARLTGEGAMGTLFKAMALAETDSPALPGFPC